ncbi:MAG: Uma2 family endonuclease [Candidatus Eremiobacteraeota bacterium]|nr:Uma2 family endonuclease [Candidatus Eremiobacteraeota bacterium]
MTCGSVSKRGIEGAPDLLIEILSESTARYDRVGKMQLYARFGVEWYWIADPREKTLEEFHNENGSFVLIEKASGDSEFSPKLFHGLVIPLSKVWEGRH